MTLIKHRGPQARERPSVILAEPHLGDLDDHLVELPAIYRPRTADSSSK
jgi:hypothetical protein